MKIGRYHEENDELTKDLWTIKTDCFVLTGNINFLFEVRDAINKIEIEIERLQMNEQKN